MLNMYVCTYMAMCYTVPNDMYMVKPYNTGPLFFSCTVQ